ncbi:MAG: hypothetical protein ACI4OP_01580 [Candidatus Coprovivens sp.]
MKASDFKKITKQYGFELNPLLESIGDYCIYIDNIYTSEMCLAICCSYGVKIYNPIFYRDFNRIETEQISKVVKTKEEFIEVAKEFWYNHINSIWLI